MAGNIYYVGSNSLAWPRRIVRRIEGVRIPYLNLDDLIASKQTGCHSDEADLEVLRGLRKWRGLLERR